MAFYLSYLVNIGIYSVILFTIMVTLCKKIDAYLPKMDKTKKKWITTLEIYIQILLVVSISYISREILNYYLKSSLNVVGSPDRFAILILGTPMFSQQPQLLKKIKFIWSYV